MAYKIDLHTHSIASPDGSLSDADYRRALEEGLLDVVAVTDHNTIDFATQLHAELGQKVIIGEEITTAHGEIIGLFLKEVVPPHLSARETIARIKAQGGLVYIPHPFETFRQGMSARMLESVAADVDIIEVHNGRTVFQNYSEAAKEWAVAHRVAGAASSDAHGPSGWGRTYALVTAHPERHQLVELLHRATYEARWPGMRGILYPKINRIKKRLLNA